MSYIEIQHAGGTEKCGKACTMLIMKNMKHKLHNRLESKSKKVTAIKSQIIHQIHCKKKIHKAKKNFSILYILVRTNWRRIQNPEALAVLARTGFMRFKTDSIR